MVGKSTYWTGGDNEYGRTLSNELLMMSLVFYHISQSYATMVLTTLYDYQIKISPNEKNKIILHSIDSHNKTNTTILLAKSEEDISHINKIDL